MKRTLSATPLAAVTVAVVTLLAACGGGGGDDNVEVEPSTVDGSSSLTSQILTPSRAAIAAAIAQAAAGKPVVELVRRMVDGDGARPARAGEGIQEVTHAVYDPTTRSIVISGRGASGPMTEDVRLIEHDGTAYVIVDLYQAENDALDFTGRGITVPMHEVGRAAALGATPVDGESAVQSASLASVSPILTYLSGISSSAAGVSNGVVFMPCGTAYNGRRVINDVEGTYVWTVRGTNFGSTRGTVTVAGRTAKIVSWTSTEIQFDPTVPWTAVPISTTFTIRTASGLSSAFGISIAPAIRSRVFGQCTNEVAYRRLRMGLQPSTTAYGSHRSITASYIPTAGDQYAWNGSHVAIVTAVSRAVSGAFITYTITITERNALCTNAVSSYQTRFQVKSTSTGLVITERPKSSVPKLATAETLYYR